MVLSMTLACNIKLVRQTLTPETFNLSLPSKRNPSTIVTPTEKERQLPDKSTQSLMSWAQRHGSLVPGPQDRTPHLILSRSRYLPQYSRNSFLRVEVRKKFFLEGMALTRCRSTTRRKSCTSSQLQSIRWSPRCQRHPGRALSCHGYESIRDALY